MSSESRELLEHWSDLWSVPELWARRYNGETELPPDELVRQLCAGRLLALTPLDAALELVRLGEFAAAEALADDLAVEGKLTPEQTEQFALQLREWRSRLSRRFDAQLFELFARSQRLGASAPSSLRGEAERARQEITDRLSTGQAALRELSRHLAEYEAAEAAMLRDEMDRRLGPGGADDAEWVRSAREAIANGDLVTARFLLEHASMWGVRASRVPWRERWPYSESADEVMGWFRGEDSRISGAFRRLWGIRADDRRGWDLLAALEPLVTRPGHVSRAAAEAFFDALESTLADGAPPQRVHVGEGVYWRRIAGLRAPGLYAFNGEAYDEGVIVAVAAPFAFEADPDGDDEGELTTSLDGGFEADTRNEFGEEAGVVDGSEVYAYFGAHPLGWPIATGVHLSPDLLLRHLGDAHRAHNLRRQIAIRLPLPGAYPGPFPLNDGDFVLGRDAELRELVDLAAPVLWLGAPGSGLTTLLRAASRAARARSWAVVDLPLNFGPGGARDALTTALRTQAGADLEPTTSVTDSLHRWLRGSGYEGLLLTIDGVDRLPGAAGEEILQLFRGVQRHGEFPVRALATALPTFSGADHRLVSPYLPADAARELVEEVTDFLGISFDPFSAADRLIYYSGRHVALLHQLLWGLVEVLGDREPGTFLVAGPDEVDRAARSGGFRIELDRTLELITPHPELRAALAALVLEEEARGSAADTSAESLHEWVHGARPTLGVAELRRAATQLEALGLAVRLTSGWRLPPGGVPHLISDRIGNAEDFLDQAITDWNTRSAPREAGDARPQ